MNPDPNQILPDDSYSNPVDLLQHPECSTVQPSEYTTQLSHSSHSRHQQSYTSQDDDVNYSFPVDMVQKNQYDVNLKNYSPQKNYEGNLNGYSPKHVNGGSYPSGSGEREVAVRPTQLDLKAPLTKSLKPR